ncbi:hypothetical protein [Lysobacter hankyongensis]|uniref:hypothetical protein n=1 Tax=Lysobacter hankyongensis TaxID=1176535 RepID=UPI0031F0C127
MQKEERAAMRPVPFFDVPFSGHRQDMSPRRRPGPSVFALHDVHTQPVIDDDPTKREKSEPALKPDAVWIRSGVPAFAGTTVALPGRRSQDMSPRRRPGRSVLALHDVHTQPVIDDDPAKREESEPALRPDAV